MEKKIVYRYFRDDGGTTVSTDKPDCEYTEKYRLVAKKGMVLKKGDLIVPCVDVTDPVNHGWTEIEAPVDEIARRKAATNWSTYAAQIRAIEDYPEITGG